MTARIRHFFRNRSEIKTCHFANGFTRCEVISDWRGNVVDVVVIEKVIKWRP